VYKRQVMEAVFKNAKVRSKFQLQEQRTKIDGCICRNNVIKPTRIYDQEKYCTVIAFPMDDQQTISSIENAMRAAFEQNRKKLIENAKELTYEEVVKPIKEDYDIPNFYFLRATSTKQPEIIDAQTKPLQLTSEPVFGARAKVSVLFRATKKGGIPRIYADLQNIQLIKNKNYLEDINTFTAKDDFDEIPEGELE